MQGIGLANRLTENQIEKTATIKFGFLWRFVGIVGLEPRVSRVSPPKDIRGSLEKLWPVIQSSAIKFEPKP